MTATTIPAAPRQTTDMAAYREARRALWFARLHDWGQDANIRLDRHGDYYLSGVIDAYTADGDYFCDRVAIPATIKACREFGDY